MDDTQQPPVAALDDIEDADLFAGDEVAPEPGLTYDTATFLDEEA